MDLSKMTTAALRESVNMLTLNYPSIKPEHRAETLALILRCGDELATRRRSRKEMLRDLTAAGYAACLAGKPCEFEGRGELNRAAWEIGWRAARADRQG